MEKIQLCSDVKWVIHREMWPIPTFVLIPRITMDAAYFSKAIPSYLKILDIRKFHIFALRWRDEIRRSSQLRTLLKRVVVNRT